MKSATKGDEQKGGGLSNQNAHLVDDLPSRVTRLETAVGTIHDDLTDLKSDLRKIAESLSQGGRTNWTLVFSGIALMGGMYAAAVRPMTSDIARQQTDAEKIATAVLLQNNKISELEVQAIRAATERTSISKEVDSIITHGSPSVDKRLSILEYRFGAVDEQKRGTE